MLHCVNRSERIQYQLSPYSPCRTRYLNTSRVCSMAGMWRQTFRVFLQSRINGIKAQGITNQTSADVKTAVARASGVQYFGKIVDLAQWRSVVSIDCDVPGRSARELLLGFSSFSRMNHLHIHGTWTTRFVHSVPDKKLTMARVRFLERGGKDPPRARGTGAVKDPRTRTTADSLDPGKFIYRGPEPKWVPDMQPVIGVRERDTRAEEATSVALFHMKIARSAEAQLEVARRGAAHLHTPGLVKVLDRLACEHNKYLRTKEQKRTARNDPGFLAMCHRISEAAKMPASPLAPQEMVKVVRAYTKLGHDPGKEQVANILTYFRNRVQEMRPTEPASVMWFLATMNIDPGKDLARALSEQMAPGASEFRHQDTASALFGLGALRHDPGRLVMQSLGQAALRGVTRMSVRELVQSYWAHPRCGYTPSEKLLIKFHKSLVRMSHSFSAEDIVRVAWALCSIRHDSTLLTARHEKQRRGMMYMLHRCIASKSHELNREQLATILWSYANVNHHPGNEMMELLEKKVGAFAAKMDKPTSMKVLTSFARLEYPLKADILGELAQKFVSSMPDMSPAEFAHFVWACVKLKNISTEQYSPKLPPRLIANVDGGVSKRLQKFHSNDIAKVSWAIASLVSSEHEGPFRYIAPKGMVDLLHTEIRTRHVNSFSLEALRMLHSVHVATADIPDGWGSSLELPEDLREAAKQEAFRELPVQSCLERSPISVSETPKKEGLVHDRRLNKQRIW